MKSNKMIFFLSNCFFIIALASEKNQPKVGSPHDELVKITHTIIKRKISNEYGEVLTSMTFYNNKTPIYLLHHIENNKDGFRLYTLGKKGNTNSLECTAIKEEMKKVFNQLLVIAQTDAPREKLSKQKTIRLEVPSSLL